MALMLTLLRWITWSFIIQQPRRFPPAFLFHDFSTLNNRLHQRKNNFQTEITDLIQSAFHSASLESQWQFDHWSPCGKTVNDNHLFLQVELRDWQLVKRDVIRAAFNNLSLINETGVFLISEARAQIGRPNGID